MYFVRGRYMCTKPAILCPLVATCSVIPGGTRGPLGCAGDATGVATTAPGVAAGIVGATFAAVAAGCWCAAAITVVGANGVANKRKRPRIGRQIVIRVNETPGLLDMGSFRAQCVEERIGEKDSSTIDER